METTQRSVDARRRVLPDPGTPRESGYLGSKSPAPKSQRRFALLSPTTSPRSGNTRAIHAPLALTCIAYPAPDSRHSAMDSPASSVSNAPIQPAPPAPVSPRPCPMGILVCQAHVQHRSGELKRRIRRLRPTTFPQPRSVPLSSRFPSRFEWTRVHRADVSIVACRQSRRGPRDVGSTEARPTRTSSHLRCHCLLDLGIDL